jgi:hypothetical protein
MIKINKKPKTQPAVTQNLNTSQDLFKVGDKVIIIHEEVKVIRTISSIKIGEFTGLPLYFCNSDTRGYYARELKKLNPTKQEARIACANQEELCFIDAGGFLQQGIPQEVLNNPVRNDITHVRMNGVWHVFFYWFNVSIMV